jgi:hypothetical protein
LRDENFYSMETDGAKFIDWLTALITSELPASVHCANCGEAPKPAQ